MSAPKHHNPGFLALVNAAKSRIHEIDIAEYQRMRAAGEPHILIDTRENDEWAAGHAAGAMHLGKGIIERDIEARGAAQGHQAGAVLRRRVPLRAGGRCAAPDGLHQRDFARWRLARLPGVRASAREVNRKADRIG